MKMKKKLSEKAVYTILWTSTAAAAALVIILTVFAASKRAEGDRIITAPIGSIKTAVTTKKPTKPPVTSRGDTQVDGPAISFFAPVSGKISKGHSLETLSYSLTMNDYRTHSGVDIPAEKGSAVVACLDGKITGVYKDPLMGNVIELTHEGGYKSVYMNLADEMPEAIVEGGTVRAGQTIGAVGESAICELADEPHLHFELYREGQQIDPAEMIDFGK